MLDTVYYTIIYIHVYIQMLYSEMQMKLLKDIEMLIFHFLKDLTNNCKASLWSCRVNNILDLALHHFKMLSNIVFTRVALRKGQLRELFVDSQLHNCTFVFVKRTLYIVYMYVSVMCGGTGSWRHSWILVGLRGADAALLRSIVIIGQNFNPCTGSLILGLVVLG